MNCNCSGGIKQRHPMTATLEFHLPEAADDLTLAINATKLYGAMQAFENRLRYEYKHRDLSEEEHAILDEIRVLWADATVDLPVVE